MKGRLESATRIMWQLRFRQGAASATKKQDSLFSHWQAQRVPYNSA